MDGRGNAEEKIKKERGFMDFVGKLCNRARGKEDVIDKVSELTIEGNLW